MQMRAAGVEIGRGIDPQRNGEGNRWLEERGRNRMGRQPMERARKRDELGGGRSLKVSSDLPWKKGARRREKVGIWGHPQI